MRSFLDAKPMAKDLREALALKGHALSHSACLEIVAKQFGFSDWNTLSAMIERITHQHEPLPAPEGWFPTGNTDLKKFRMGLDHENPGVALIESRANDSGEEPSADMFGCLMQNVSALTYRGQKLVLSAQLRANNAGLGTIWMRIDDAMGRVLRFDNMMERKSDGPISGTTGWTQRSIVLDVPAEAESIHYGFFLKGTGQVRARAFDLTIASTEAPVTAMPPTQQRRHFPHSPTNLQFVS